MGMRSVWSVVAGFVAFFLLLGDSRAQAPPHDAPATKRIRNPSIHVLDRPNALQPLPRSVGDEKGGGERNKDRFEVTTTETVDGTVFAPCRSRDTDGIDIEAMDWTTTILHWKYHPPERSRFVFLAAANNDEADRVQLRYGTADGAVVTVTQTSFTFCVQIEYKTWKCGMDCVPGYAESDPARSGRVYSPRDTASELEYAENVAHTLFSDASGLALVADPGRAPPLTGGVSPAAKSIPPWLASLRWREIPGGFSFTCMKDRGVPTAAIAVTFPGHPDWHPFWFSGRKNPMPDLAPPRNQ